MAGAKDQDYEYGVYRKEIGRQCDEEIAFGDDDMTARRRCLEFFDLSPHRPGPDGMGKFVAKDINPHRLGQQPINDYPAERARNHGYPHGVSMTARLNNQHHRPTCSHTDRQQQQAKEHF